MQNSPSEVIDLVDTAADPASSSAEGAPDLLHAPARLLEYDWGRCIALPLHATLEVIERPTIVEVPGAPYYARGMMRWQDRWIAVIDLCTLVEAHHKAGAPVPNLVLVLAYQRAPGQPLEYGGLAAVKLPTTVRVHDGQVCPLPTHSDLWPLIATSCFSEDGRQAIPIVDPSRLFTQTWD